MRLEAVVRLLLARLFTFLSWPSFALLCPLFASFWAVESKSWTRNQQCLAFWVLFAVLNVLEQAIGKLLLWVPFWPHMKGIATVLLVMPYFAGASYVYMNLARPYLLENSSIWNFMESKWSWFGKQCNYVDANEMDAIKDDAEGHEKPVVYQGSLGPGYWCKEREHAQPAWPNEVQKNWSCALCMVTTSSENCLKQHLMGKKHKENEERLRVDQEAREDKLADEVAQNCHPSTHTSYGRGFLINLVYNEIWSGILNPVATSVRWCRWEKPDCGWIKLNTDGSRDKENAGIGGLLRDGKGKPLCAFVSKAPRGDIFFVELLAIWRGLVLASSLGIRFIWVESDSMSVVKTINREQSYSGLGNADGCLRCIWELLKKFKKYHVSHSFREANRAADYLSKTVLDRSDVVLSPSDFPGSLWRIIRDDSRGRLYCRK